MRLDFCFQRYTYDMKDKIYVVETEAARGNTLLASNECNEFCEQNNAVEYIRKDTLIERAKAYFRTDLDYFIDREEGSIDTEDLIEDFILEVIEVR